MNTAHPLAATLAQIHRLSLDGTLAEITPLADQALALLEKEAGTPSSRWASAGEPDPHGTTYDCERAALAHGDMTDDELANAVFLDPNIGHLTAAKDRIRWLSRKLQASHPSRGVVDEDAIRRALFSWDTKYGYSNVEKMRAALQAAALPAVPDGFRALAERALPFIHDEAKNYEDDGSNEPLELAREIESLLTSTPSNESAFSSANLAFDGGVEVSPCPHSWADNCDCFAAAPAQEGR